MNKNILVNQNTINSNINFYNYNPTIDNIKNNKRISVLNNIKRAILNINDSDMTYDLSIFDINDCLINTNCSNTTIKITNNENIFNINGKNNDINLSYSIINTNDSNNYNNYTFENINNLNVSLNIYNLNNNIGISYEMQINISDISLFNIYNYRSDLSNYNYKLFKPYYNMSSIFIRLPDININNISLWKEFQGNIIYYKNLLNVYNFNNDIIKSYINNSLVSTYQLLNNPSYLELWLFNDKGEIYLNISDNIRIEYLTVDNQVNALNVNPLINLYTSENIYTMNPGVITDCLIYNEESNKLINSSFINNDSDTIINLQNGFDVHVYWSEIGSEEYNDTGKIIKFKNSLDNVSFINISTSELFPFGSSYKQYPFDYEIKYKNNEYYIVLKIDNTGLYSYTNPYDSEYIIEVNNKNINYIVADNNPVSSYNGNPITSTVSMFEDCSNLEFIDLSNFDTSSVTDMSNMFRKCTSLKSLDLSNFDTGNVTNMHFMFINCTALTSLDLSNFDNSSVTDMSGMFNYCIALTSLDLSNFDTRNVTKMNMMFNYCTALTSLDLNSFNTINVSNMNSMFNNCTSLTNLDLSNFDTRNVSVMTGMFVNCTSLKSLDLSNFDTSSVTDIYTMFYNCTALTNLDLSKFDTRNVINVINMQNMFYNCRSLTNVSINFNCSNISGVLTQGTGKSITNWPNPFEQNKVYMLKLA